MNRMEKGNIVIVDDISSYKEEFQEKTPFVAEVIDVWDISILVKSKNTGKEYEVYSWTNLIIDEKINKTYQMKNLDKHPNGNDFIADVARSLFKSAYGVYWDKVKDFIDKDGWVYTKEVPNMLDAYYEHNTGNPIEFQKSFGASGDNPHWLTRGSRWRPKSLSNCG